MRSGYVAAKSRLMGAPSATPNTAARREPTASMTARRSSIRASSVGAPATRSDMPVPRLSNRRSREKVPSSLEPASEGRHVPPELDVRDEAGHVDEVERPASEHLVGDGDFSAPCVQGFGTHGRSLARSVLPRCICSPAMEPRRVVIVGAAGRDFHNFNVLFRDSDAHEVVAFTATQIPNIDGRVYPYELAGHRYPVGIPIRPEAELEDIIAEHEANEVVFSYSDVSHEHVMHIASRALAAGADFRLVAPQETELPSRKPCVAICAVRTGAGKSQTSRRVTEILRAGGHRVAVLRHPDAVRRSLEAGRAALRALRGSRRRRLHDRGARGVRAAHRRRQHRLRRHRLRADPRPGRGRGRRDRLGGRQQRHAVHPARPPPRASSTRTAPATSSASTRARRTCAWPTSASSTRWTAPPREPWTRCSRRFACTTRRPRSCSPPRRSRSRAAATRSTASACSASRTGRR